VRPGIEEPAKRALEGRRILIVEPEATVGKGLSEMLVSSGCEVVGPATTAQASMTFLRRNRVDGAIVGFHLLDRNAHPVMDELSLRGIPYLLTSALAAPDLLVHWRPYVFLRTPLMLAEVQNALLRMLG
jgi:hypothetical protein